MTKQEALKDLREIADAVSTMGENHDLFPINKAVTKNWVRRLNKIIATLER